MHRENVLSGVWYPEKIYLEGNDTLKKFDQSAVKIGTGHVGQPIYVQVDGHLRVQVGQSQVVKEGWPLCVNVGHSLHGQVARPFVYKWDKPSVY